MRKTLGEKKGEQSLNEEKEQWQRLWKNRIFTFLCLLFIYLLCRAVLWFRQRHDMIFFCCFLSFFFKHNVMCISVFLTIYLVWVKGRLRFSRLSLSKSCGTPWSGQACHMANTEIFTPAANIEPPINPTAMSLDCGKKHREHENSTQAPTSGHSCCKVTVLTTAPACDPKCWH